MARKVYTGEDLENAIKNGERINTYEYKNGKHTVSVWCGYKKYNYTFDTKEMALGFLSFVS